MPARPHPFGIDITGAPNFYWFTLIVFAVALFFIWRLTRSPFGAALQGARDQPRRMRMLGHNVWLIQWLAFVLASFWGSVAGLLYVYYNLFISPHAISLQQSAEVLLMAILGGASTLTGPIVGAVIITLVKNVVVDLRRPLEHAARRDLRHRHHVHAVRHRARRAAIVGALAQPAKRLDGARRMTPALEVTRPEQALRRPAGDAGRVAHRDAGRAAADHRAERRRQDHAVQSGHRRSHARRRLGEAVRAGAAEAADAAARASRARAHLSDPHAVSEGNALPQRGAGAARPRQDALERVDHAVRPAPSLRRGARGAGAGRPRRQRGPHRRGDLLRRTAPPRNGDGAGAEAEGAAARRAARGPFAGGAQPGARAARHACRATSPS